MVTPHRTFFSTLLTAAALAAVFVVGTRVILGKIWFDVPSVPGGLGTAAAAAITLFFAIWLSVCIVKPCSVFRRSAALALFVGCAAGFLTIRELNIRNSGLYTLAQEDTITAITGRLSGDPVPAGPQWYRVRLETESVQTNNGEGRTPSEFSASGTAAVLIPKDVLSAGLPGGIRLKKGPINRLFPADGMSVAAVITGRSNDGLLYIAETVTLQPFSGTASDRLVRLRSQARYTFFSLVWRRPGAGGLFAALLSGNREYLDENAAALFRSGGLSHLLALSGMHLGLVSLLAGGAARFLGGRRWGYRSALVALFVFVWFTGFSPSLFRALLQVIIAGVLGRGGVRLRQLSLLSLTFLIHLLMAPSDFFSPAFILSYCALAGILVIGSRIYDCLQGHLPDIVLKPLCASSGAWLAVAPVSFALFGVAAPGAILSSCIAGPLVSLFLIISILSVPAAILLPGLFNAFFVVLDALYALIISAVTVFTRIPPLHSRTLTDTILYTFFLVTCIVALCIWRHVNSLRRSVDANFARL